MAHGKVLFEDPEDGQPGAAVRFQFTGGYDPKSHAHQLMNHLRVLLDQMEADGALTAVTPDTSAARADDKQIALLA